MKNKSESTTTKKAGRPSTAIKWPNTKFTVAQAADANPSLCALTIRKRLRQAITTGEIAKLPENRKSGKAAGRPCDVYAKSAQLKVWSNLKNSKKVKSTATATATPSTPSPSVDTEPTIEVGENEAADAAAADAAAMSAMAEEETAEVMA